MVKDDTLYRRIGVAPTATKEEIKRQYKILSKTAHPDKNRSVDEAEANRLYQEINQAKEVLLDDEKRRIYDQVGMEMLNGGAGPPGDFDGFQSGNPFDHIFGGFGSMFAGAGGGGMFAGPRHHPEHLTETLNVTLEQLFTEQVVDYTYKHKVSCSKCDGNGTKDGRSSVCGQCNGAGVKVQIMQMGNMIQQSQTECGACRGKGQVIPEGSKCLTCQGKTYVLRYKTISVPLRKGLSSDNKLHLPGQGHQLKGGPSDLMLSIHELPHKVFKRQGNNLCLTVDLKLYQALYGFTKQIEHLDGRKLLIQVTGRTEAYTVRKIAKEGLMGDLFLRFKIEFPDPLNAYSVQLKTLLKLMEPEEVTREGALKSSKSPEVASLPCTATETVTMLRLFDRVEKPERAERQERAERAERAEPAMRTEQKNMPPQCAQQ